MHPCGKYCGTNCRSKAYRRRQKSGQTPGPQTKHVKPAADAAPRAGQKPPAKDHQDPRIAGLQDEISRLGAELQREQARSREQARQIANLLAQNQELWTALQRADHKFHWMDFLGGLVLLPLLQSDLGPKLLAQLAHIYVARRTRKSERPAERVEPSIPSPAQAAPATASEAAAPPSAQPTADQGGPAAPVSAEPSAEPYPACPAQVGQPRATPAAPTSSAKSSPPEPPGPEELVMAIVTLRRFRGQELTGEQVSSLQTQKPEWMRQELASHLRALGDLPPDGAAAAVPTPAGSASLLASELLRGSKLVGLLFNECGKQAPLLAFPAAMVKLPERLDELCQQSQAVLQTGGELPERTSRLRVLLDDLERWLAELRPVAKQAVSACVLYAATYTAHGAVQQVLQIA